MKDIFPGYYKKNEDDLVLLWEEGIICFDTNVLLNLYRYSTETREAFLSLIDKIKDKIFLPHQAALEYNRNRFDVISEQEKAYKDFRDRLKSMQKDLEATSKPPFLLEETHESLLEIFTKVYEEIENNLKIQNGFFKSDPIYENLSKLFKDKITKGYNEEELNTIFADGEKRYEKKIPPGYQDIKKPDVRKYGDLVLWKQVLDLSKKENKSIILITDEKKDDWWWKILDDRTMGPRHELVEEFKTYSGKEFHMYSSERFLSFGQSILKEEVNERALDEIKEFNRQDILTTSRNMNNGKFVDFDLDRSNLREKMHKLNESIHESRSIRQVSRPKSTSLMYKNYLLNQYLDSQNEEERFTRLGEINNYLKEYQYDKFLKNNEINPDDINPKGD